MGERAEQEGRSALRARSHRFVYWQLCVYVRACVCVCVCWFASLLDRARAATRDRATHSIVCALSAARRVAVAVVAAVVACVARCVVAVGVVVAACVVVACVVEACVRVW